MELLLFDRLEDTAYQSQVYDILKKCDHEFVPPLSQRVSTTQSNLSNLNGDSKAEPRSYFQQLLSQSVILAVQRGQVLGFMSFRGKHICEDVQDQIETIYMTTVIVDPLFRGRGVTECMYRFLMDVAQKRSLPVSTRTWSTNHAHIKVLFKLGFRELLRIRNGRGEGIDTVYYRKGVGA